MVVKCKLCPKCNSYESYIIEGALKNYLMRVKFDCGTMQYSLEFNEEIMQSDECKIMERDIKLNKILNYAKI